MTRKKPVFCARRAESPHRYQSSSGSSTVSTARPLMDPASQYTAARSSFDLIGPPDQFRTRSVASAPSPAQAPAQAQAQAQAPSRLPLAKVNVPAQFPANCKFQYQNHDFPQARAIPLGTDSVARSQTGNARPQPKSGLTLSHQLRSKQHRCHKVE